MRLAPRFFNQFGRLAVCMLAALALAACGSSGIVAPVVNTGNLALCHATGDATTPYAEITVDFDELTAHGAHPNDLIPAPAGGCPSTLQTDGNAGKITICHATGSATNPYTKITLAFNALRGHSNHKGDVIPAPASGCPDVTATATATITATPAITVTPTITATPLLTTTPAATLPGDGTGSVTLCHATGSAKNPYVMITVSVNGLNGHGQHTRDIIPAPTGGCPTK